MVKITFVERDGLRREHEAPEGWSALDVAIQHEIASILGRCCGGCVCATCHVYVDAPYAERLPAPSHDEVTAIRAAAFDRQPNLLTVHIATIPERMSFDVKRFTAKPGQPVKLVFSNPDLMQNNLVIVKPGALEEVGVAGNEMAKDPDGIKKDFVPVSDKIIHATKLIDPRATVTLRFNAPTAPGLYQIGRAHV